MCDPSHSFVGCVYSSSDIYTPVYSKWQIFLGPRKATLNKNQKEKNVLLNYFTMKKDLALAVKTLLISKPKVFTY